MAKFLDETGLAQVWALIRGADVKIATGSYTGTSGWGESNPNSLTFDFVPKFVAIMFDDTAGGNAVPYTAFWCGGSILANSYYGTVSSSMSTPCNATLTDKTLSWYSETGIDAQMDYAGKKYRYIAIG